MQVKNTFSKLLLAAAALAPLAGAAQTSSINAFSPYTMFGIGEINTPGTLQMRSMGGVGVAMRNVGRINLLNPAAFSATPQKSFIFSFGLEGQNYYNAQNVAGVEKRTAYNTFNFHDIAFQLPLARNIGLGFSLTPYSSVGYRIGFDRPMTSSDPVAGQVGRVSYNYEGEGDITEVKLGVGWEIAKNFSIGAAAQYYWGDIDRTFSAVMTPITTDGSLASTVGTNKYSISSFKGQVGLQWNAVLNQKRALTLGATYDFGGDLNPRRTFRVYNTDPNSSPVRGDTTHLALVLPRQLAVGAYYQTVKWSVGFDYVYQNWAGRNRGVEHTGAGGTEPASFEVAYRNTSTFKVGVEFTPGRYDVRRFLKRWSYRAGFRYGTYNQTFGGHDLREMAVTLGFGVPIRFLGISTIDVGVEYGRRGYNVAERIGLVRQQYLKFAVGFSLFAGSENNEYWFVRPRYE